MFVINTTISNLAIITRTPKAGFGPSGKMFFWVPARGGRAKNLYTKSKTLSTAE
jgi:hypothetical protein